MGKKKDRSGKKRTVRSRDDLPLRFEPWRVKSVFDPLTSMLDELEQLGTVTVCGVSDAPIFKDAGDGTWYESVAALQGVVEAYEIFERRTGQDLQLEPLRQLALKLEHGELIDSNDTRAVRACIDRMWSASMKMTVGEARQLINDFKIKEGIENLM